MKQQLISNILTDIVRFMNSGNDYFCILVFIFTVKILIV